MKKIIIVTLQSVNFGNRLQNYALQTHLEKMGYEVSSFMPEKRPFKKRLELFIKVILGSLKMKDFVDYPGDMYRERCFKEFDDINIHNKICASQDKVLGSDWEEFDYAVTGSDQVWHGWTKCDYTEEGSDEIIHGYAGSEKELEYYYLNFISPEKRVAYAGSFGFEKAPVKDIPFHKKGMLGLKSISCREESGCEIVKRISGRDAVRVVDPTLLLDKEDWLRIAKKPKFKIPEKYMLVYFLGDEIPEYRKEMKDICDEHGLEIINVYSRDNMKHFGANPSEFIWLVQHASYVCTDSFHCHIFSIFMNIPFTSFKRSQDGLTNMFGRIQELLDITDIHGTVFGTEEYDRKNAYKIDYRTALENIKKYRKVSFEYLDNALKD